MAIYHERQSLQMCALHVLNNLFQSQGAFNKRELDDICASLTPTRLALWNPHRSALGLGNYDVNVIMAALESRGFRTVWFDKRRDVTRLRPQSVFGFILNVPSHYRLLGILPMPYSSKHWLAIRRFADVGYFNLDSNLKQPELIGQEQDLLRYLSGELSKGDKELLLVVANDTLDDQMWVNLPEEDQF